MMMVVIGVLGHANIWAYLQVLSKSLKLCQVVYHSTRLDGTKVVKLPTLWLLWIKGKLPQTKPMFRMKKDFVIHSEELMTPFFFLLAIFRSFKHRTRKIVTYLEFWGNSE